MHAGRSEDEALHGRLQNPATGQLAERPALLDGLREVAPGHVRYQVSYCHYGAKMVRHSNCERRFLPGASRLLPRKCVWAVADLAVSTARWRTCRICCCCDVDGHFTSQCRRKRHSYGPTHRCQVLWPKPAAMTAPRLCTDVESELPTFHHHLTDVLQHASLQQSSNPCSSCLQMCC